MTRAAVGRVVVALACLLIPNDAVTAKSASPVIPVRIELGPQDPDVALLQAMRLDLDGVFHGWARAYVNVEERRKLVGIGFRVSLLPDEGRAMALLAPAFSTEAVPGSIPPAYHSYDSLTAELEQVAIDHPGIVRLFSIGQSVQGRELWMLQISGEPGVDEDEPEVAFISSIHGNEVVGRELMVGLIHHLTDRYGLDDRVDALVDGMEIWIMPSMNPDGSVAGQRYNASGVDLNRDFPDPYDDPYGTSAGRQPETAAVMAWAEEHSVCLGANLHGGALVANYPFDNNAEGASVFSPSPDQDLYVSLARTYADNNPSMSSSNSHSAFDDGITNGADWYALSGGLQDWSYVWNGALELTLELGATKWPPAADLPGYWEDNLESMLAYLERARDGLRGRVFDAETGSPLAATLRVGDNPFGVRTDPDVGDYHRPLLPGSYALEATSTGYERRIIPSVVVPGTGAARLDVALQPRPTDLQPSPVAVHDGPGGDGWLDPGESADLVVELRNLGRTASTVRASLEPTGWYADVSRPAAAYPDLAPGEVGDSEAPHHGVSLAADIPAGHKLGFVVRWESAQGSGSGGPFFLPLGAPECRTFGATDLPAPIADGQSTVSRIIVDEHLEVTEVQIVIDLTHTYVGDLQIQLGPPSGSSLMLHNRGGGTDDDIVGRYGDNLTPVESLDALDGFAADGPWSLTVTDLGSGDTGTLNEWGLEICGRPFESSAPELRFANVSSGPDGVSLDWWPYPGLESYRVYRSTDPSSFATFVDLSWADDDDGDTKFVDRSSGPLAFYLVSGVGPQGEGLLGHFGR